MAQSRPGDRSGTSSSMLIAAPWVLATLLWGGCSGAAPEPFAPTVLQIRADAATGPDYVQEAEIEHAGEVDYFELELKQAFNSVVVMTTGDTDTGGRVETRQRTPITALCPRVERHKAEPPCVWGYDADIDTPHPERSDTFNGMPASKNFLWEGNLDAGTYLIGVIGERGATGAYALVVELGSQDCPTYYCDD